ncbi:MAG: helix-turn-helix domain-containing protein [Anderseniella sp.]|nr:helix-turn-helix domain-containing protein [Anderseniella sp.]
MTMHVAIEAPANQATSTLHWMDAACTSVNSHTLHANQTLFHDGDDANFLYEVLEGTLMVFSILPDGRRQIFDFYHAGDIVGLSHNGAHYSNCVAIAPTKVRCIPQNALARVASENPEIAIKLFNFAADHVFGLQSHFIMLGRKSATEKVASFLLDLVHRVADEDAICARVELPMKRAEIADYLGMTIETVSRNISKLRSAGIIELPEQGVVIVPDVSRLEEHANAGSE